MKNSRKICILGIFILFIILLNSKVYAGEQKWKSLDYDVVLNVDGSADITETWNVYISETNTMFKQFDLSSDDTYKFKNVKVAQLKDGIEIPLTETYKEKYHVDSGCYYGLMIKDNVFEIAWNVDLDNSYDFRVYKIYYTVENAVKVYSDCSEFYWQFLSRKNTMIGDNITGKIHLPKGVTDIEKLHIWGHGDFSGNTERTSTNELAFDLNHISSNEMLEIRVVTEENVFESSTNTYNKLKLTSILDEEAKWANEANLKRNAIKVIIMLIIGANIAIGIVYYKKILKYKEAGKELDMQKYPKMDLQYFREIPDEKNATPARAAYMYYFDKAASTFENSTSNIFSATLLQLTLKRYISLEPIDSKNVRINICDTEGNSKELTDDEKKIYDYIIKIKDKNTNSIDTKTFEKYAKKHYDDFHYLMDSVCESARKYKNSQGIMDNEKAKVSRDWSSKGLIYTVGAFLCFCFMPILIVLIIEWLICMSICYKNAKKVNVLTKKGYEEVNQWRALKKYMEDFSLLKEKQVPDLILWEKYLVYATTFGISKKVLEQLIKVYPQLMSDEYYRTGNFTYLHLVSNSGLDSISRLDKAFTDICRVANSAYTSAHSSSDGSGGGFSGGGGGRRRWRKLRRKVELLYKVRKLLISVTFWLCINFFKNF